MEHTFDNCPTCGKRIKDTDENGMEAENGQRWCQDHFTNAEPYEHKTLVWVAEDGSWGSSKIVRLFVTEKQKFWMSDCMTDDERFDYARALLKKNFQ